MRHGLALVPLAALAGCASVGAGPSVSSVVVPPAFVYAPSPQARGTTAALLPTSDPAFQALLVGIDTEAPDLQIALARVDAARAALRAAGAARSPNVGAEASAAFVRSSERAITTLPPGVAIDPTNGSFASGITASWDLDLFGRLRASQRAASLRLNAADADARAVRLALVTDIARGVADYRAAQGRLRIIEDDLADAASLIKLTGIRTRAGIAPGLDLVRARGLEAAAQSQRGPAQADLASALGRLITLTASNGTSITTLFAAPATFEVATLPPVGLPSALLTQRPDIVAAQIRLGAANADVAAAAASRFPQISINAALGLAALALGDLFSADALTASVGGSAALPLLDFGRIEAQIDARQADARQAFAEYRRTVFLSIGEVESALGSLAANRNRLSALEAQLAIEQDTVALSTSRYRMGLSDFLGVIDAQRQLNATRQALLEAKATVTRSQIQLYRSVGG